MTEQGAGCEGQFLPASDCASLTLSNQLFPPFIQLFKGKFYHCLGVDTRNITNRSDCVAANYRWVHHKYNFDNLGQVSTSGVTGPTLVLRCWDRPHAFSFLSGQQFLIL